KSSRANRQSRPAGIRPAKPESELPDLSHRCAGARCQMERMSIQSPTPPIFPTSGLGARGRSPRGMALVVVLAVLVLIAVLVLGFFGVAQQERTASGFYESGANARHLVDTATGVVTAQIQEATSDPNLAWISQPGLLRTFDSGGQVAAYKLY